MVAIDKNNGSNLWQDVIQKEMENVMIAFQIIPNGERPPNGYQYVNCLMVFDIKRDDFQRMAFLVGRDHVTHTPDITTYSSVVTRKSVCMPSSWLNDVT